MARELLMDMDQKMRVRAREILDAILCSGNKIGWDRGQRLRVDGRTYPKTNITDMIEYVLTPPGGEDNAYNLKPKYINIFTKALKRIGLEPHWIVNENVKKHFCNAKYRWLPMEEDDDDDNDDDNDDDDNDDDDDGDDGDDGVDDGDDNDSDDSDDSDDDDDDNDGDDDDEDDANDDDDDGEDANDDDEGRKGYR